MYGRMAVKLATENDKKRIVFGVEAIVSYCFCLVTWMIFKNFKEKCAENIMIEDKN